MPSLSYIVICIVMLVLSCFSLYCDVNLWAVKLVNTYSILSILGTLLLDFGEYGWQGCSCLLWTYCVLVLVEYCVLLRIRLYEESYCQLKLSLCGQQIGKAVICPSLFVIVCIARFPRPCRDVTSGGTRWLACACVWRESQVKY